MSDLATDPIRDVIVELRKGRNNKDDPMRSMIAQLIFSTLANRLESQADEIERLRAALQQVMARLADILESDQFNNIEALVLGAGVDYPAREDEG